MARFLRSSAVLLTALMFLSGCASGGTAGSNDQAAAAPTATPEPGDPRSEVCDFTPGTFKDGVIETEDGTSVYVAVQGSRPSNLASAESAPTTNTLCLASHKVEEMISCGAYYTGEGIPIVVQQSGLRVVGSWHVADAATAAAETSSMYWSECSEEILFQTGGYGGSTINDAKRQESSLADAHILVVANRLEAWAAISGDVPLQAGSCSALNLMDQIASTRTSLARSLPLVDDVLGEVPASASSQLVKFQDLVSEAVDLVEEDSPIFGPLFELWFSAYFEWPLIVDEVDVNDPGATEDDILLARLGAPAREGMVITADTGFASQAETIAMLQAAGTSRCDV